MQFKGNKVTNGTVPMVQLCINVPKSKTPSIWIYGTTNIIISTVLV